VSLGGRHLHGGSIVFCRSEGQIQMVEITGYTVHSRFHLYSVFFISSASVKVNDLWQTGGVNTNAFTTWLTQSPVWHHLMKLAEQPSTARSGEGTRTKPEPWPRTMALKKGSVIRFGPESHVQDLVVFTGSLWLTETPGVTDHVLEAGDEFHLGRRWPVVVQALTDSVIWVC